MAKDTVKCRFTKCSCFHDAKEINKAEAVRADNGYYYHPDCFCFKNNVDKIHKYFIENIDQTMTWKQKSALYTIIYDITLNKGIDVEYLYYAIWYMNIYKKGKLKHMGGLYYILDNKDILESWKRLQNASRPKQKVEILDEEDDAFEYVTRKPLGFEDILRRG